MQDGTCSSCGSGEVYAARNGLGFGDASNVAIRAHMEDGFRGSLPRHLTKDLWTYCCAGCGLVEVRVHDPGAIEFVCRSWVRVAPTPPA